MPRVYAKTIFKTESPISGTITVQDRGSRRELFVKGVKQSSWSDDPAEFEGSYWQAASRIPFLINNPQPNFLVCGLGGGTIPKLLLQYFPTACIMCLEIDPVIIQIANEYFNLTQFPTIQVTCTNANSWITRKASKHKNQFDAIYLDTFFGEIFSIDTQQKTYIKIREMLHEEGVVITNRIYNEYKDQVDKFVSELSDIFSQQQLKIIEGYSGNDNLIIFSKK